MESSSRELAAGPVDGPPVLLLHGFSGSPTELWPLARALADAGYRAHLPCLPGHGGPAEALVTVTADDLVAFVREKVNALRPRVVAGLSMGALLALAAASEPPVEALVVLAAAARLRGASALFRALGLLPLPALIGNRLISKGGVELGPSMSSLAEALPDGEKPPTDWPRLHRVPLGWGRELARLQRLAHVAARRVTAPTLVLHGALDRTAAPSSALVVAGWLGGRAQVEIVPDAGHQLVLGARRDAVSAAVSRFLREHVAPTRGIRLPAEG